MTEGSAGKGPRVAFVGLGRMGLPMATRLHAAGFEVRASDALPAARDAFAKAGGTVAETPRLAAEGADVLITMLPDGKIVRDVLLGSGDAVRAMAPGGLVIDMSSSAPTATRALADDIAALGRRLLDAPVSGGVRRAADGTLAIMAGGEAADLDRARPILEAMGTTIVHTGASGTGHAMKALNNYVSAAGLAAACEALLVGQAFGIDPAVMVDTLNVSTGRNNSTELKLKPFVLSGTFASGFAMALMAKDLRTAADLAEDLGLDAAGMEQAAELWTDALGRLGQGADHTEIYRFLQGGLDRPKTSRRHGPAAT